MHICVAKVAIFALFVKIRALVRAFRLRREEIDFDEERFDKSSSDAKLLKHRKNLERTARTIQGTARSNLYACMQCMVAPSQCAKMALFCQRHTYTFMHAACVHYSMYMHT